jgi:hypothetical protein
LQCRQAAAPIAAPRQRQYHFTAAAKGKVKSKNIDNGAAAAKGIN